MPYILSHQGWNKMKDKVEIKWMLDEAIIRRDVWKDWMKDCKDNKSQFAEAVRSYNALRGVVKTLQWALDFPGVDHPLN